MSRVYFDRALGRNVDERLLQQITGAYLALDKVSLIVRYLNQLDQHKRVSLFWDVVSP